MPIEIELPLPDRRLSPNARGLAAAAGRMRDGRAIE